MLDIVLVNWNSGIQLENVISSIAAHHDELIKSVIVVDNASTDNSMYRIESGLQAFPFDLKIICNSENHGFGFACNQGAAIGTSEFVLFLNPDTLLFSQSLLVPINFLQKSENFDVGIVGIQLIDEKGVVARSCANFPTVLILMAQASGLNRLPLFHKLTQAMVKWPHDSTRTVDQVIGAFFLVRRSVLQMLHGFDEKFFVYFEEVDLALRACQMGFRSVFLVEAQAFHAGGGTSHQVKARRLFYFLRSRLLYAFKHFSWIGAVGVLLATLLVEPFSRSCLALLRLSWPNLKETWAAYSLLWLWLPQWIFKGVTR